MRSHELSRYGLCLGLFSVLTFAGCGGGSSNPAADQGFVLGGTLTGLAQGAQVLLLSGAGTQVTLTSNGNFEFSGRLKAGVSYAVTVNRHPVAQTCTVSPSSGTIPSPGTDARLLTVVCANNPYTLGGTVTGLRPGANLTLLDGGRDGTSLMVTANGSFTFPGRFGQGGAYNVSVQNQPEGQECRLTSANGSFATANISTVGVTCSTVTASVGGTVTFGRRAEFGAVQQRG